MKYLFFFLFILVVLLGGIASRAMEPRTHPEKLSEDYAQARRRMVEGQIHARGIRDARVLEALSIVPRHLFVPGEYAYLAYSDGPLPIGKGQTISQPYIVAFMTEALTLNPGDRVLEVGTGSGYQAAVLGEIVKEVYTIEIVPELAKEARNRLEKLGYSNISVRTGDGYLGWPAKAPFDAIIVTAAPEKIPPPLIEQLKDGGRLCIPVGSSGSVQSLLRIRKTASGISKENLMPVRFVPLIREGPQ